MNFETAAVEEFLAWEPLQAERYEYADGSVSMLPGGTGRHEVLGLVVASILMRTLPAAAVRGSNMRIRTAQTIRYPDVAVTLDPRDVLDEAFIRFPVLIVEILSPSTERADRGAKFDEYRTIETLQEYVLIDSRRRWVQIHRRSSLGDGSWISALPISDGTTRLESVHVDVDVEHIYGAVSI